MKTLLEFEKPIAELEDKLIEMRKLALENNVDVTAAVASLTDKILELKKETFSNLTRWQRVQLSRHPDRPYTFDYIEHLCEEFIEIHGDRNVGDDKAMVGGFGTIDGEMSVMFIGTPGAFPGLEAEERGQGEAIARNIRDMFMLKVPVICVIIGEGASGGALGIAVGDRVLMMENTWYSVISPESCSSILWRSWNYKEQAAEALKLTANDMLANKLIDGIIPEPLGGAHLHPEEAAATLKEVLKKELAILSALDPATRISQRIDKFGAMGEVIE